jgi:hypothetical protein
MLSPGSRVASRALVAVSSPIKCAQSIRYLGPVRQFHIQPWSARAVYPTRPSILTWKARNDLRLVSPAFVRNLSTSQRPQQDVAVTNKRKVDIARDDKTDNTTMEFTRTETGEAA